MDEPSRCPSRSRIAATAFVVGLLVFPLAAGPESYAVATATNGLLFAVLAASWAAVWRTGLLSLGHAGLFGLGAYTSAITTSALGLSPWAGSGVAALTGAAGGALLGALSLRLKGPYFAIGTLAVVQGLRSAAIVLTPLTNGPEGFVGLAPLGAVQLGSIDLRLDRGVGPYAVLALATLLTVAGLGLVYRGRLGLARAAIASDEVAAAALGVAVARHRTLALALAGLPVGWLGGFYAHLIRHLDPSTAFDYRFSFLPLVFALLGGVSTPLAPVVSTLVLYLPGELVVSRLLPTAHQGIYGLALVVGILFVARPATVGVYGHRFLGEKTSTATPAERRLPGPRGPGHLSARSLEARYGRTVALRQVDLDLAPGEAVGVVGPNGSGKSTLLNVLGGQVRPTSGAVYLDGQAIVGRSPHQVCRLGVGRTFQVPRPFGDLTVVENVLVGWLFGRAGRAPVAATPLALLDLVDLTAKADRPARTLSLGELKRLELARALATAPTVLLLDEVTAGLTPAGASRVARLLRKLRDAGLSLVMVEHSPRLLGEIVHRTVTLDEGRVVATPAAKAPGSGGVAEERGGS